MAIIIFQDNGRRRPGRPLWKRCNRSIRRGHPGENLTTDKSCCNGHGSRIKQRPANIQCPIVAGHNEFVQESSKFYIVLIMCVVRNIRNGVHQTSSKEHTRGSQCDDRISEWQTTDWNRQWQPWWHFISGNGKIVHSSERTPTKRNAYTNRQCEKNGQPEYWSHQ